MRKVYQDEKNGAGLAVAVFLGVAFTALLFGFIPFAHRVNKPSSAVELVRTSVVELPPPQEEETRPPEQEAEKPPEAAPEPQLAEMPQQIPLNADLEVAVGSGGALAGFGEVRALAAAQEIQDDTFDVTELEKRPEAVSQ